MLKYYCEDCNLYLNEKQIDKNTNKCMICKERIDRKSERKIDDEEYRKLLKKYNESSVKIITEIFWCKNCGVPSFFEICDCCGEKLEKIAPDLRPVFPEEQLLIDILIDGEIEVLNQSVWYTSSNRYIVNGKSLSESKGKLSEKKSIEEIRERLKNRQNEIDYGKFYEIIDKFVRVNKNRLLNMTEEAIHYINKISADYGEDEMFISFSGGKDSTVVDDLVKRTLRGQKIIKIFGDTTLEFPLTYEYVNRIKKDPENRMYSPIITSKNRKDDFYKLCEKVGPPSRLLRWCCTYFKTTPISDKIDLIFKNKKKVLTFYGIRRNESLSRSKYDMESDSPKIAKQRTFSPIIDWFDFDIWLYILGNKVDFNDAYKLGYSRVGCWCCPNNNKWSMFLAEIYMKDLSEKWNGVLMDFAIKTGKSEPEKYVSDGSWRARQGGNGLSTSEHSFLNYTPCVTEDATFNYQLTKPISEQLYELFKPFGNRDKIVTNDRKGEVYFLSRDGTPVIRLQGRVGTSLLKVSVMNYKKLGGISKKIRNIKDAQSKIECQLTKYQLCTGCSGCKSACKHDAISIKTQGYFENGDGNIETEIVYKIDESKCVKCGECIDHYESGCYMKKVLRIKREK